MSYLVNPKLSQAELEAATAKYLEALQKQLLDQLFEFMKKNYMNQTDLGRYLGYSKGYMSQLFKGNFDHKLSTIVQMMVSIGKIPEFSFKDI